MNPTFWKTKNRGNLSANFLYKTTDYYAPEFERSLIWNDPKIAIAWPLDVQPIVSAKDAQKMSLTDVEVFV